MRNHCPSCGGVRRNEANVISITTVWFTCANCNHVWRSSLLGMALGSAIGSIRRKSVSQNVDVQTVVDVLTTGKTSPQMQTALERGDADVSGDLCHLERALAAVDGVGDDTSDGDAMVAAQLASWSTGRDTEVPAPTSGFEEEASTSSFDDQLDGLSQGLVLNPAAAHSWNYEDDADDELMIDDPETDDFVIDGRDVRDDPAVETSPLLASTDRMLKNVDDLCAVFQRLEQQLGGMERWCEELIAG